MLSEINTISNKEIATDKVSVYQKPSGPIVLKAKHIVIQDSSGNTNKSDVQISLCGCGKSLKPPYCDGSHKT